MYPSRLEPFVAFSAELEFNNYGLLAFLIIIYMQYEPLKFSSSMYITFLTFLFSLDFLH